MKYNKELERFWKNNNFKDIKHPSSEFPEGWDARDDLVNIVGCDTVAEVGCGYGRLVGKFQPSQYVGYDINPACVERAQRENRKYKFRTITPGQLLSPSDWVFMYTVALHVDDNDIEEFLGSVSVNCNKFLIAEVLGRERWRNKNGEFEFAFNRDVSEYVEIMTKLGFALITEFAKPYKLLHDEPFTFLTFAR